MAGFAADHMCYQEGYAKVSNERLDKSAHTDESIVIRLPHTCNIAHRRTRTHTRVRTHKCAHTHKTRARFMALPAPPPAGYPPQASSTAPASSADCPRAHRPHRSPSAIGTREYL